MLFSNSSDRWLAVPQLALPLLLLMCVFAPFWVGVKTDDDLQKKLESFFEGQQHWELDTKCYGSAGLSGQISAESAIEDARKLFACGQKLAENQHREMALLLNNKFEIVVGADETRRKWEAEKPAVKELVDRPLRGATINNDAVGPLRFLLRSTVLEAEDQLKLKVLLVPIAVLSPPAEEGEVGEDANGGKEDVDPHMGLPKFLIVAFLDADTSEGNNKLMEFIKDKKHVLLECSEPELDMERLKISEEYQWSVSEDQINVLLKDKLQLEANFHAYSNKWEEKIKESPEKNLLSILVDFVNIYVADQDADEPYKAKEFALIKRALTDENVGKRLLNNKKKVRGLDLLTKVQKEVNAHRKIPIVYLKKELKAALNQLENRIKEVLGSKLLGSDMRLMATATRSKDSALFLLISPYLEGVLQVDRLNERLRQPFDK